MTRRAAEALDRADRIEVAIRAGATQSDVARDEAISRERVRQVVAERGIDYAAIQREMKRVRVAAAPEIIARAWAEGATEVEAAKAAGITIREAREVIAALPDDARVERNMRARRQMATAPRERQRTEGEYLEMLRVLAAEIGRTPGVKAFAERYSASDAQMLHHRFGSYAKACEAAGLVPNARPTGMGLRSYSDEDISAAMRRIGEGMGRPPTYEEYDVLREPGEPSGATIRARSGSYSWMAALDLFYY